MADAERICLFYSREANYATRLKAARDLYPQAHLEAWIPPDITLSEQECSCVDTVIRMESAHYSPREPKTCIRLIKQLRTACFNRFVVMFNSFQLNMLAALSKARHKECWDARGTVLSLPHTIPGVLLRFLFRRTLGLVQLLWVWGHVYLLSLKCCDNEACLCEREALIKKALRK